MTTLFHFVHSLNKFTFLQNSACLPNNDLCSPFPNSRTRGYPPEVSHSPSKQGPLFSPDARPPIHDVCGAPPDACSNVDGAADACLPPRTPSPNPSMNGYFPQAPHAQTRQEPLINTDAHPSIHDVYDATPVARIDIHGAADAHLPRYSPSPGLHMPGYSP